MELKELIKNIVLHLKKEKIDYMIIGGQAVLLYGEPRLTKDIDITLNIGIEELNKILGISKILKFKILTKNPIDFVKKTLVLPAFDSKTGMRVDFIFSYSEYEKQAIKRAKKIKIKGTFVKFCAIEDLVIHKIISGRPRDLEDVKIILMKNKFLDEKYLTKWLKSFEEVLGEDLINKYKQVKKSIK